MIFHSHTILDSEKDNNYYELFIDSLSASSYIHINKIQFNKMLKEIENCNKKRKF